MGYVIEVRHLVAPTAPSPTLIIGMNTKKPAEVIHRFQFSLFVE